MAKIDLKSASHMVAVCREDCELLGIHWQDRYFVDTCLPFGLRSAPYLFNQFAKALHWILIKNYAFPNLIYLYDYLISIWPHVAALLSPFLEFVTSLASPCRMTN